jgi:hypothetical protein
VIVISELGSKITWGKKLIGVKGEGDRNRSEFFMKISVKLPNVIIV